MRTLLRHLLAVAMLPFVVTVLIPVWLARGADRSPMLATTPPGIGVQLGGVLLLAIGLLLFASSLRRFVTEGKGTLAPWDPPRELVLHGPYRYVRNPMISGVIFILFGEALILISSPQLTWALIFLAANMIWIPLFEEPQLERRFGDSYREYRRHVRRFIPRLQPWSPTASARQTEPSG